MVKSAVADWDTTAAGNTDVGGINIAENCAAAGINNALREMMAQIATYSDTIPTLDSASTFTANIKLNDGIKALFGTDSDLTVYHSGTQALIQNATGNMVIDAGVGGSIALRKNGGSENMAAFNPDGAVTLYYDGASKLSTNSTGVTLTGIMTADNIVGAYQTVQVAHTTAAGTAAGTFTSGSEQVRPITSSVINDVSGASVDTGTARITLPAGTYDFTAWMAGWRCGMHRAILYNITDSAQQFVGLSVGAPDVTYGQSLAIMSGRFAIAASKVFEIRHYCTLTSAGSGMGVDSMPVSNTHMRANFFKVS